MTMPLPQIDQYAEDRAATVRNRAALGANRNLLYWYSQLYAHQFRNCTAPEKLRILEIGSGVSPLQRFYPNVLTSDVLELDYLDYVFDCHAIDRFDAIEDGSLDVITLTNVLHHLKNPIEFLNNAACKLCTGGKVIATEPYFSTLSMFIFTRLHHEPVDFDIPAPVLPKIRGPLASANIALPWIIFTRKPEWGRQLTKTYEFDPASFAPFTSISYMATGGISRRLPVPTPIYRAFFSVDRWLAERFPQLFTSFFTIELTRK